MVDVEISGTEERRVRGIVDSVIRIGRDPASHVVLGDAAVSRNHAVVEVDGEQLWITNFSVNGTLVDGRPVTEKMRLDAGLPVRVADYTLRFLARRSSGHMPKVTRRNMAAVSSAPAAAPTPASAPPAGLADDENVNQARRRIHRLLIERLDLASMRAEELRDERLRPRVVSELDRIISELREELPAAVDTKRLREELADEVLGLGPLETLITDEAVTEIMVVDRKTVYVERKGRIERVPVFFTSDDALRAVIERIVTPLGRRIDEAQPLVDARLKDGSRVNAIIPPLALRGACITIRKFAKNKLSVEDLQGLGSINARMAKFLQRCVIVRKNILISGGTGSGKTTLLNILSGAIPSEERIITVEDAAELRLQQPHVVSLETRPPNLEGKGEYTIRDLVRNSLRMRPDRIVVGECRGGEALDMLQAMNTGHDGSLTTVHANSPQEAIARVETLSLMAGVDLPSRAIREQIGSAIHVIVQIARLSDGSRRVTHVSEVTGIDSASGEVGVEHIFQFVRTGTTPDGKIVGEFRATGYLPSFLGEFVARELCKPGDYL